MNDETFLAYIALLVEDDDLFGNDEEEQKRIHEYWVRPWIGRREECDTAYTLLRELQAVFERLQYIWFDMLTPYIQKQRTKMREPIRPAIRLAVTMRFLAFGQNYPALSHDFRLGVTTIMNCIRETCVAIYTVLKPEYLKTPKTESEWREVARGYSVKWNYPHCIGALDGKHMRVQKPRRSGSTYYNYKGFLSITLLALVDANYQFIYVDVGRQGRQSDGGLWDLSRLRRRVEKGRLGVPAPEKLPESNVVLPYCIVADDAFPLTESLMKPFSRRDLDHTERVFNYRLSWARRCSENAFGILATRFRLFLRDIEAQPKNATKFVLAGICLHNLWRERCGKSYLPPGAVDGEDANNQVVPGEWRRVVQESQNQLPLTRIRNSNVASKTNRIALAEYFQKNAGSVPWQNRAIDCGFVDPRANNT